MSDEKSLEQKAFEDLDVIYGLADAAQIALIVGNEDDVEKALDSIKSISKCWRDPDSDSFEEYDHE